jgi:hypothetical protein
MIREAKGELKFKVEIRREQLSDLNIELRKVKEKM